MLQSNSNTNVWNNLTEVGGGKGVLHNFEND